MIFVKPNQPEIFKRHVSERQPLPGHKVFTLVHFSDPHLFSPGGVRLRDILNKRLYGYLSWYLHRGREHSAKVLSALLKDLKSDVPDHIAITGDLTHLGLPKEFLMAGEWLRSLAPPSKVTVIPGNHDTYVAMPWEHTFRLWSDYMASDADHRVSNGSGKDMRIVFPTLRVRKGIALIGVSTAKPTPPFFATGSIGAMQIKRLENILIETRRQGLLRVILIHHPPISGGISRRKRLTDQAAFQKLIALHGADLILYGHIHHISSGYLETPLGKVLAIGVPSVSALGRNARCRARYHFFSLIKNKDRLELLLSVRVYSSTERRFVDEGKRQITLPQQTG